MAKYECIHKRAIFPKGAIALTFKPMKDPVGLDKDHKPIFFGALDTANAELLQAAVGETTESLDAFLQSRDDFKNRVVGKAGIWLEEERIGKVVVGYKDEGKMEFVTRLGLKGLRSILAIAGKPFAPTDGVKELAAAAAQLTAAEFETATASMLAVGQPPAPAPAPASEGQQSEGPYSEPTGPVPAEEAVAPEFAPPVPKKSKK